MPDFQSLPHTVLDQTPTRPSSPSSTAYASNFTNLPILHLKDNNNDLYPQPYDYSTRLSPVNLEADSVRKQRKRKITRKIIKKCDEYENEDVLDYSSTKPCFNRVERSTTPSLEAVEQVIEIENSTSQIDLERRPMLPLNNPGGGL